MGYLEDIYYTMRSSIRKLASHNPKLPLIFPLRPPGAPTPPTETPSPLTPAPRPSPASSSKPPAPTPPPSLLPRPRPDYTRILFDPSLTTANHFSRRSGLSPEHVAHISRLRDTQLLLLRKLESVRSKQNELSNLIKNKLGDTEEFVRQAKKLKVRVGDYEKNLSGTEEELVEMSLALPNFTSTSTPLGPEENAVEIDQFGPTPIPSDPHRDHLRICTHYDLLDGEASATATGSSWPYLRGVAALLEMALINYSVRIAVKHGYTPVIPPDVVKMDIANRCGFAPRDSGGAQQTYAISDSAEQHVLAGTAEIPLSALFANRVLSPSALPSKVVGVGHAFRAEAGARGSETRGLYRVHQFTKVELFCVTDAEGSEDLMESMKHVQKEIAEGLGLSVRVLEMPSEELGASAARKWDMEAWMPGRGKWGEVCYLLHSCLFTLMRYFG